MEAQSRQVGSSHRSGSLLSSALPEDLGEAGAEPSRVT